MSSPLTGWRTSVRCQADQPPDNCVEVGNGAGIVGVRDTKDRDVAEQPTLVIRENAFAAFLQHLA